MVPPVTAERSPPLSRITGADSPVIAASSTEATPSITSPSLGIRSPASTSTISPGLSDGGRRRVAAVRRRSRVRSSLALASVLRLAQRGGLRLAAAFGHGFGEIGEQHGEPEPEIDLERQSRRWRAAGDEVAQEEDGGQRGDDLDHEHHRIADQDARIELAEGIADRRERGSAGSVHGRDAAAAVAGRSMRFA